MADVTSLFTIVAAAGAVICWMGGESAAAASAVGLHTDPVASDIVTDIVTVTTADVSGWPQRRVQQLLTAVVAVIVVHSHIVHIVHGVHITVHGCCRCRSAAGGG